MRLEKLERFHQTKQRLYFVSIDENNIEHWTLNGKEISKPKLETNDIVIEDDI